MGVETTGIEEAHVIAGNHRQRKLAGGVQGELVERHFAIAAGAGQLQMQVVAEGLSPREQLCFGHVMATGHCQPPGQTLAAGNGAQAGVVSAQPLRVDRYAIATMTFQPGTAEQARQAQVATVVAAQQGQQRRRIAAIGNEDVGAGNRFDAHALGGLVKLDQREQVVAVGNGQRRQPQLHRAAEQIGAVAGLFRACIVRLLGHADGGIGEREFGVQVQVDEGCRHRAVAY